METKHKQFKPFDKVLVRIDNKSQWEIDLGSTDEPEEEIELMEGEWVMVCDEPEECAAEWMLREFRYPLEDFVMVQSMGFAEGDVTDYKYCIRFSDFDPIDMEKTMKHILCAKNGKIVRYRG